MERSELKVGELYEIIGNTSNHEFPIGSIVRFIESKGDKRFEYQDKSDFWWVSEIDVEPYAKPCVATIPKFLYKDCGGRILIGYHGDTDVTEEWNEWLKTL